MQQYAVCLQQAALALTAVGMTDTTSGSSSFFRRHGMRIVWSNVLHHALVFAPCLLLITP
jgi:hypothetical protein